MTKSSGGAAKKTRAPADPKGYATYLHKIMKKVCSNEGSGNTTISSSAMAIANELISDLEERIADKAFVCTKVNKKSTLAASHVQTAAYLVLPKDMAGMAVQEASKALAKFTEAAA